MLKKFSSVFTALSTMIVLSACASTSTATITESAGRVTLAESHIGEAYDVVMARAAEIYKVEPQCEGRRIALSNQRKAFLYDICGFNPADLQFSDAPLSEVVYHFIERELVRVDVRAQGESILFDKVVDDMQVVFADSGSKPSELKQGSFEWVARQQVAGVRAGAGAGAGNIHVRLLDESLKDSAPWLAAE